MNEFGRALKRMRVGRGLKQYTFAKQMNMSGSTYTSVEIGQVSMRAPSVQRVINSGVLTDSEKRELSNIAQVVNVENLSASDKKQLKKVSKTIKKEGIIITDEQRLAYRRIKNEKYAREMELPRKVRGREIKQAIPRSMTQRMFH